VYPKSVKMITFPKIEDNIKEFNGVMINKIIKNNEIAKHIHTFWVDLAYSIIIVEEDEVIKIYKYYYYY
jgi:hypothetical protein